MVKIKTFAYIRVSSKEQKIDRQLDAIKKAVQEKNLSLDDRDIFIDKLSGKNFDRENYQLMKKMLRPGDLLIIKELDRLGRDWKSMKEEWQELQDLGITILILDSPILTTMNKGDLETQLIAHVVLEVLIYTAERERKEIEKRQKEGIQAAKKRGKHLGRPRITYETLSETQKEAVEENFDKWKTKEITAAYFMELLALKRNTFYKIMRQYEGEE